MSSLTFASLRQAPNPGPMTLDGTNSWLLRGPGSASAVVVDPGPADEGHLATIAAAGAIQMIMLTHFHHDHTEGVDRLLELVGDVPVTAADPALCRGIGPLRDGDRITAAGVAIEVIAAPGHTADSVCLLATCGTERCVCSGDTILGRGTTVVSWPDGNLADYLVTLDKLSTLDGVPVLTGHGPVRPDCGQIAREYRAHRDERLVQVRAALAAGAQTPSDVVAYVYPDLEAALRPAAESTVRSALAYLAPGRGPSGDAQPGPSGDAQRGPSRDAQPGPSGYAQRDAERGPSGYAQRDAERGPSRDPGVHQTLDPT